MFATLTCPLYIHVHMFTDSKGDCKGINSVLSFLVDFLNVFLCLVGDFGLATSSLAAVDPSDVSLAVATDADMTLGKSAP